MINILITFLLLSGCVTGSYQAPVSDREQPPPEKIAYHIVAPGETLYSIAWRYGLDYQSLARANGIGGQFQIYPGQRLNLNLDKPVKLSSHVTPSRKASSATQRTDIKRQKDQPTRVKQSPVISSSNSKLFWHWPIKGQLYQRFSSTKGLKKGIDILGKKGESVLSAAAGRVVYAGDGLRGYGKLLIIKHNETFLSAYAHNNKIVVKEGDIVKAAQKIAEVGSTGTVRNMLHFEIRRNGVPVDPEVYLPR